MGRRHFAILSQPTKILILGEDSRRIIFFYCGGALLGSGYSGHIEFFTAIEEINPVLFLEYIRQLRVGSSPNIDGWSSKTPQSFSKRV